jgi:hypothetical protein
MTFRANIQNHFDRFRQHTLYWFALTVAFTSLIGVFSSCGPVATKKKRSNRLVTNCQTPQDQSQSFQGRWLPIWSFENSSEPITLTIAENTESAFVSATAEAVSKWNAHFSNFKMTVMDLRQGAAPSLSSCCGSSTSSILTSSLRQFAVDSGVKRSVGVHFLDPAQWQSRYGAASKDVLAFTEHSFLSKNGHPMNHLFKNSIIVVNKTLFTTPQASGVTFDLVSVLTHELGHLLGLRHSCNQAEQGLPDCETAPDSYLTASLFPAFAPGEVRKELNENDQGRINCVYGPSAVIPN